MNFEAVIGLEIHVEMKTKTKMFSSAPVAFSREVNCNVAPLDMAFPGTMPVVNKQAVIYAIRVANALHMEIDHLVRFDRKNYFYSDLPKGFQITQQFHPIGKNGYLEIEIENVKKRIGIERIHMEEDTCKQLHAYDYTLLDYNRAGIPLVEIVSLPEMRNGTEAMKYVEKIRNIVTYALVSDGKMEEGSLRCDVNISLRPCGQAEFGTKVEIKNLNSLKNIESAIDYEIERQSKLLLQNQKINQETRRYDEGKGKTILMRVKTDAVDYKYFPEPNITPIKLSDEFVNDAINSCPELYDEKLARYVNYGLSKYDAEVILANIDLAFYFEKCLKTAKNCKDLANFLIVEVNGYLNKNNLKITEFKLAPETLAAIVNMQADNLSHAQVVQIFNEVLKDNISPSEAKEKLHIVAQVKDENVILEFVNKVLDNNHQSIVDYKNGKDRALGFLVGQVMKESKGKLSPQEVSNKLKEELNKR